MANYRIPIKIRTTDIISQINEITSNLAILRDKFNRYADTNDEPSSKFGEIYEYLQEVSYKTRKLDIETSEDENVAKSKELINKIKNSNNSDNINFNIIKNFSFSELTDPVVDRIISDSPDRYSSMELATLVKYLKKKRVFYSSDSINKDMYNFLCNQGFIITINVVQSTSLNYKINRKISCTFVDKFLKLLKDKFSFILYDIIGKIKVNTVGSEKVNYF